MRISDWSSDVCSSDLSIMPEQERPRQRKLITQVQPEGHCGPTVNLTRRTFMHRSLMTAGVASAATCGWFPLINTIDVAHGAEAPFKFAWVSDTHLYPKTRSEEHTSELQSLMRNSYAVFCLKKTKQNKKHKKFKHNIMRMRQHE